MGYKYEVHITPRRGLGLNKSRFKWNAEKLIINNTIYKKILRKKNTLGASNLSLRIKN